MQWGLQHEDYFAGFIFCHLLFLKRSQRKKEALTPPKGRVFIGSGDFVKHGNRILSQFVEFGGLKPTHRVLDMGCGIGRLSVPLTNYIDREKGA